MSRDDRKQQPAPAPAEQRQLSRFRVDQADGLEASLDTASRHEQAKIADLSLGGAGLLVTHANWRGTRAGRLAIRVAGRMLGDVAVDLVHTEPLSPGTTGQILGVRYRSIHRDFLGELCRYLVPRHSQFEARPQFLDDLSRLSIQNDPRRVRRLLAHLIRGGRIVSLFSDGTPLGSFAPHRLLADRIVGTLQLLAGQQAAAGDLLIVAYSSRAGLYLLQARVLAVDGKLVQLGVPSQLLEGGPRRLDRFVPPEEFRVQLEFLHPLMPGHLICKVPREIGLDGLRFDLDIGGDLLVPGMLIDSAMLRLPDGPSLPCRCVVRHTVQRLDGSYQCGVQIIGFHGVGRDVWVERVLAQMNPGVEEATPLTLDEAWAVFDRSGYLEEKPAEQLLSMREPFLRTWQTLLRNRGSARFWLHRNENRTVGTICASRIYRNTWLIHHLAVDRTLHAARKLLVLADLGARSALQWLMSTHPEANLLVYYDAETSFNRAAYTDFLGPHLECGDVSLRRLQLREYLASSVPPPQPDGDLWVKPPAPAEIERVSAELLTRDDQLRHRALDFYPRGLQPPSTETMEQRGVPMRELLVAGEGSELLGFAIVEIGRPAVNIFSLYDTTRMVIWGELDERAQRLVRVMVSHVGMLYRQLHRRSFLLLSGPGDAEWLEPPIFQATAVQAVIAPSLVPHWFQHLSHLWGQR